MNSGISFNCYTGCHKETGVQTRSLKGLLGDTPNMTWGLGFGVVFRI